MNYRLLQILFSLSLLFLTQSQALAYAYSSDAVSMYNTADYNAPWHPTKIQQDDRGFIWISSWNGLYRFDGYQFQSFKPMPGQGIQIDNDRIRDILMTEGDTLLCRYDEHVYAFNVATCQFSNLPDQRQESLQEKMQSENQVFTPTIDITIGSQTFSDIQQRFTDRQGNQWLRSTSGHIYCIHPDQRHGSIVDGAASQDVPRRLYRDSQGYYWVCSRDNQQVVLYDADWQRIGYLGQDGILHTQPTAFAPIYCVFDDGQGTLWLGSKPDGLYRLKRKGERFAVERIPMSKSGDGLPTNAVYDIQADRLGTLWMATWDNGIICIDNPHEPNAEALHYITLAKHCNSYPEAALKTRRIVIRPDGTLLATTTRGVLIIDDIYGSLSQLTMHLHRREADRSSSLTTSATMSVAFDAQDHLFIATESGGVCIATDSDLHADTLIFQPITAREGLISDVTFDFASTPDGNMLVLCPNGISVINQAHEVIKSYGPQFWNTEAPFTECTPQIIGDSVLVLVHEAGIIRVPIHELTQDGYLPNIVLTSVSIGSDPVRYDMDRCDTLWLSPTHRSLSLSFSALDLRSNRSLRYRTRLNEEGSDDEPWSRAMASNDVQLQDLRPGTYQLQICSSNADGQWPDNVRTITIIVEPKFFETWYGKTLLWLIFAMIIASLTGMVIRMRRTDAERHELLQTYLALLESTTKAKIAAAAEQDMEKTAVQSDALLRNIASGDADTTDNATFGHISTLPTHLSVPEQQFMQRLLTFVEENISNCNVSLADMAEATATSKSSLTRKTNQLLGITPADFLKEARLKRACQLLRTSSQTLTEISLACGFSDPKYFSKCFKASTGKTPTEYRS